MMKALEEIGFKNMLKFLLYSFLQVVYHQLINHLFQIMLFHHLMEEMIIKTCLKNAGLLQDTA